MMLVCYFFKLCRCIVVNKFRAGVQLARYPEGPHDTHDDISMEALAPQMAGRKIEEKLERLLTPASRSISFNLIFGSNAKKQKPVVLDTLTTFVSAFHVFFTEVINLQSLGTTFLTIPRKKVKKNIVSR